MFGVFSAVKKLLKIQTVCIDNKVFQLHYKITVAILFSFSIMVTSRQYIGDSIDCFSDYEIPSYIMDTYCWSQSTFTTLNVAEHAVGKDAAYPGVTSLHKPNEIKYHSYYQWICFVLFFQAVLCYVPHYLWKAWEGGRIERLVEDLNNLVVEDEDEREERENRKAMLVNYLVTNLHSHNFYAIRFFVCEVLNFVNAFGQVYFIDFFLGGVFSTYGVEVITFTEKKPEYRKDPMSRVFPKVTKCIFTNYGSSGTLEQNDALCLLSQNIVNEKIYVFLYYWFVTLCMLSGLSLVCRAAVILGPQIRMFMFRSVSHLPPQEQIDIIMCNCYIGDWFILYQLGKNINPLVYKEILASLAMKLQGNQSDVESQDMDLDDVELPI